MKTSLPVIDETSDTFYQAFADYLQLVTETHNLPETVFDGTTLVPAGRPTWAQIRQRQIQDWKHHYGLESRAIQAVTAKKRYVLTPLDPTRDVEQRTIQSQISQELAAVTEFYQSKRELIWQAHQQELAKLGACS